MDYLMSMYVEPGAADSIVFEVDRDRIPDDLVLASPRLDGAAARASVTFAEALSKLKPSLEKTVHLLQEICPGHVEVEFGLAIGGETGIIVSKGTAEVNFIVRMAWDRAGREGAPPAAPAAT
jgi:hypothetical protein